MCVSTSESVCVRICMCVSESDIYKYVCKYLSVCICICVCVCVCNICTQPQYEDHIVYLQVILYVVFFLGNNY